MTNFLNLTSIALLSTLAFTEAHALEDAEVLGVYVTDRALCGINVDQQLINEAIVKVIFRDDLSPSEAKLKGARISVAISSNLQDSGRVAEYCAKRMGR